jgi:hypothetical protein
MLGHYDRFLPHQMINLPVYKDDNASLNEVTKSSKYNGQSFQGGDDSHCGLIGNPEDVSNIFLRNAGTHLPDHTVS